METPRIRRSATRVAVLAGAVVAGIAVGCGGAAAYWSVTGSGSGAASASTFTAPTVTATGTASGTALYPGLTANGTNAGGNLVVTATNPNPFPVTVTVTKNGAATGCTNPDVSLIQGSFTLPASSGAVSRTLQYAVSMGTNASNDCQGQTITIPLSTSSVSN